MIAWSIFANIHVHGTENLSATQNYVYMANHASLIDTPAMFAYLPYQFRIMAKKHLFYFPFMGWHLWTAGNFPIDQSDARKTARSLKGVIEGIRAGKSLAVFPEGTRSPDGVVKIFQPAGVATLMKKCPEALIVPIAINNSWKMVRWGQFPLNTFLHMTWKVLPPIELEGRKVDEVVKEAENAIKDVLGQP